MEKTSHAQVVLRVPLAAGERVGHGFDAVELDHHLRAEASKAQRGRGKQGNGVT